MGTPNKVCPLRMIFPRPDMEIMGRDGWKQTAFNSRNDDLFSCLQAHCAWWRDPFDGTGSNCAVLYLARRL